MLAKVVERLLARGCRELRGHPVRDGRGGRRGHPQRTDGRRRRRSRPRERGRSRPGCAVRDAGGGQFHGDARARADCLAHRRALRGARPAADGAAERGAARHRFTVSVEAREGVTTGISAADRAHTIQVAIDPESIPHDLVQPGHVFPLRARDGGVLVRAGQTEAAVDLARLAGLSPAGVVCEIMNEDGTMARVPDLVPYCERHGLRMITVADLIEHRRRTECSSSVSSPSSCRPSTASSRRSRTTRPSPAASICPSSWAKSARTCSSVFTRSASPATSSTRSAATAASSSRRRSRRSPPRGAASSSTWRRRGADRPPQQAQGIRAAGARPRHRRREPRARFRRRRAGVGDRQPDPRRPRDHDDAPPHEQPEEGLGRRGVRAEGDRAGADRDAAAPENVRYLAAKRDKLGTSCTTRISSSDRRVNERD